MCILWHFMYEYAVPVATQVARNTWSDYVTNLRAHQRPCQCVCNAFIQNSTSLKAPHVTSESEKKTQEKVETFLQPRTAKTNHYQPVSLVFGKVRVLCHAVCRTTKTQQKRCATLIRIVAESATIMLAKVKRYRKGWHNWQTWTQA